LVIYSRDGGSMDCSPNSCLYQAGLVRENDLVLYRGRWSAHDLLIFL